MGRREAAIDPDDHGPEAEFARGLRRLRAEAGNPTYRALETTVGYSDTALSTALSGRVRPSPDLVAALVPALGGDADEWHDRWVAHFGSELARVPAGGPPDPEPTTTEPPPEASPPEMPDPPDPPRHRRRRTLGVAVLVVLLVVVAGVAATQWVFGWFSPSADAGFSTLYAPPGTVISMRTCPSLSCASVADWHPGTRVTMTCYRDAEWDDLNYRSNRWFSVDEPQSGRTGWVHSSQVGAQIRVGAC